MIGLLLARNAANEGYSGDEPLFASEIADLPEIVFLRAECSLNELKTSELFDTIELIQEHWVENLYNGAEDSDSVWGAFKCFLNVLFRRTGELVGNHSTGCDSVFTHEETKEVFGSNLVGLSKSGTRRLLDSFVVFYRHIDLYERFKRVLLSKEEEDAAEALRAEVHRCHAFEATKDEFWKHSTFFDLPVASRLCYIHRFNGMYNDGSQVAHFHNESYERRKPPRLCKEIKEGIQEIANFRHMYPRIPLFLEDETLKEGQCCWMLLSGRIYLICEDGQPIYDPLVSNMFIACNRS